MSTIDDPSDPIEFVVRNIDFASTEEQEALYDLRFRVLREPLGLTRGTERIAQDYDPQTVHIGAFTPEGRLIGATTLIENEGLQLRAMAVDPEWQGRGVGIAIVEAAVPVAQERGLSLWCEARAHAVGFYKRAGWITEGDIFEVPTIGPHYRMRYTSASDI